MVSKQYQLFAPQEALPGQEHSESVVESIRELVGAVTGGPGFQFGFKTSERRWVMQNGEFIFAFSNLTDVVDTLGVAFDMAGGDYELFTQALRSFGVCKAWRHW